MNPRAAIFRLRLLLDSVRLPADATFTVLERRGFHEIDHWHVVDTAPARPPGKRADPGVALASPLLQRLACSSPPVFDRRFRFAILDSGKEAGSKRLYPELRHTSPS